MSARSTMLARLRGDIAHLDAPHMIDASRRVALGHAGADVTLRGGLLRGALHEVYADSGRHAAAATGFVAGLSGRVIARRPLLWVRQDFTEMESGALSMSGWRELGLDPRQIVTVRAADIETTLRVAADALACDALGVVVIEFWGAPKAFDLVASRKLTLAAQASGVTALLLRVAAVPIASTAETRWIVRAAHSPPRAPWQSWGAPVLDTQLVRNRHGPLGHWIMEWKCNECLFRDAADSQFAAAAPADRPHQTHPPAQRRRRA